MTNKTVTYNPLTHKIIPIQATEEMIQAYHKGQRRHGFWCWPPVYASVIEAAPEYQERSQWVSVDERLPEANLTILVVTNFNCIYTCRLPVIIAKNAALDLEHGIRERFTHWMPLPPAPEGE